MNEMTEDVNAPADLKDAVRDYWERETCGTRYSKANVRKAWFDELEVMRYRLEPYIPAFADFDSAYGLDVLEIGVGGGADFSHWCRHARHATGVDLTQHAIELTRERLRLQDTPADRYTLRTADTEKLPFADDSFDLVYSWGVLHHTPDTSAAFGEAFRTLRPGGRLKAMIYHVPSWTGFLLKVRFGWCRGNPAMGQRDAICRHLESPGTKAYTLLEAKAMLEGAGFTDVSLGTELAVSDLLTLKLSDKYRSPVFSLVRALYPRGLVRLLGRQWGLNLLITARKPEC